MNFHDYKFQAWCYNGGRMKKIFLKIFFTAIFGVFFGLAFAGLVLKSVEHFNASHRLAANPSSGEKAAAQPIDAPSSKSNAPDTSVDREVRYWLGLRDIIAEHIFPEDARFFYVTWLEFEDGRLVNDSLSLTNISDKGCTSMSVQRNVPIGERRLASLNDLYFSPSDPTIRVEFIWSGDTPKVLLSISSAKTSTMSPPSNDFWMKLDGHNSSMGKVFHDGKPVPVDPSYKGYVVLGVASSRLDQKGETTGNATSNLAESIADKKYVGAVVIKTFATAEELRADLEALHKIWDLEKD